ncbi:MAG TPA: SDR family NAD(P)-dependent oxidoreductase, partial [Mycobacterium sp.]|nr:SDR family NAD(P)-dependent oxidoreductase [Mycobacterium sp.]
MSKSPLRRLADELVLASMRPPIAPQLMQFKPGQPVDLDGKRILITGASSGIGEASAYKLARRGATVVVVARRKDLLDGVAARIRADGGDALAIDCDLADLDAVDA